jgi:hypothetical protein
MSLISELPDFIDAELWQHYEQHRKEIRKPLKPTTTIFILKKMARFHKAGLDVNACIEQTLENGWQGIFEVHVEQEKLPKNDEECVRFGAAKQIHAKPGESMWDYRGRLQAAL